MDNRLALVTGVTGFVAKQVALRFLQAGWSLRGTLRDPARAEEVRAAFRPHLRPEALPRLSFAPADLLDDAGWAAAMAGVDVLVHVASPFPMRPPGDPEALLRPAVEGTRRVLQAARAAGVRRVVLTSSSLAVMRPQEPGPQEESQWSDPEAPSTSAYARSKTLAERAAWEFVAGVPGMALTTINPGLVLGPVLDRHFGASLALVQRLLRGRDPLLPRISFPVVDVRDVAEMHLRAAQRPETAGRRYLATSGTMTLQDMARELKAAFPQRRIATRQAPDLLVRAVGLMDPAVRDLLPMLGQVCALSNARARHEMAMRFIAPADALRASAEGLISARAA